jgi:hypothetical protein
MKKKELEKLQKKYGGWAQKRFDDLAENYSNAELEAYGIYVEVGENDEGVIIYELNYLLARFSVEAIDEWISDIKKIHDYAWIVETA